MYGKSGNSRDSSNVYGEKGNTFEVLPFLPLSSKRLKFPEPSVWIISATLPPKIEIGRAVCVWGGGWAPPLDPPLVKGNVL